ncbi:MAG: hypothetical protein Q7T82_10395 [Armatimonadota bacterium]|nr:hypothetical protein [Armatimonadota bacterium]
MSGQEQQEEHLDLHAPLRAYLEIADTFYLQDRLDIALKVAHDAFEETGWPAGGWTELYNRITCESDARDASTVRQVEGSLSVELGREAPPEVFENVSSAALNARDRLRGLLNVQFARPALITVFLPDAPLDFISGPHGYVVHKLDLDKICIPYECAASASDCVEAMMHEFAHIAARELGGPDLPAWLNEGLATYLCWDVTQRGARESADAQAKGRELLSVDELEVAFATASSPGSNLRVVRAAYYLSATFLEFWVERFGLNSVRDALERIGSGSDSQRAISQSTGLPFRGLEREWRSLIQRRFGWNQQPP